MKRRAAAAVLCFAIVLPLLSGCGRKNEATKAAEESEETEKEGNGEDASSGKNPEEQEAEGSGGTDIMEQIAILFPGSADDRRWAVDASVLQQKFMEAGYDPVVLYADGKAELQEQQLRSSVSEHTAALVVAPGDPYALSDALENAGEAGIPVFDYDELIMDTDEIRYFITFDNRQAGHMMADRMIKDLSLDKLSEDDEMMHIGYRPDRPDRVCDIFLFNGFREQLEEEGILTHLKEISGEEKPEIICVSGEIGTEPGEKPLYLITYDFHASSIQGIADGVVDAVVFKDNRVLAEKCAETVISCLSGEDPEVSNYGDYDNGIRLVRTITCEPEIIDRTNYQILVDNGYFTDQEIIPGSEAPLEEKKGDASEDVSLNRSYRGNQIN